MGFGSDGLQSMQVQKVQIANSQMRNAGARQERSYTNRFRTAAAALVSATVVTALVLTGVGIQPQTASAATATSSTASANSTAAPTTVAEAQTNLSNAITTAQTAKTNYETARTQAATAIEASNTAYAQFQTDYTAFLAAQTAYNQVTKPSQNAEVTQAEQALNTQIATYTTALQAYDDARTQTQAAEDALDTALATAQQSPTLANLAAVTTAIRNLQSARSTQATARITLAQEATTLAKDAHTLSSAWQKAFGAFATDPAVTAYADAAKKLASSTEALAQADINEFTAVGTQITRAGTYAAALLQVVNAQHDYNQLNAQAKAQKKVASTKGEADTSGSTYRTLKAKQSKATSSTVKITWKKVSGAQSYAIYANKCGKNTKLKYKTTVGSKTTTWTQRSLKKGTYYKYVVQAFDANGKAIATSKTVHVATTGGKVGNDKSVKVARTKKKLKAGTYVTKLTLKKGKSTTLHAKALPASKKLTVKRHRGLRYESSNSSVVTVGAKSGKLTAKKKGTATIYCYTQNGKAATVKVTVK